MQRARVIDQCVVLQPDSERVDWKGETFVVVASNQMRAIMGTKHRDRLEAENEKSESPLDPTEDGSDLAQALDEVCRCINAREDLADETKAELIMMITTTHAKMWKAKFDLERPADLPFMKIHLKEGAKPAKMKRVYRWCPAQREFLRKHLDKLVRKGIISPVDSQWVCPIVLVPKTKGVWRLCVDPSRLNRWTVPLLWHIPRVREELQM